MKKNRLVDLQNTIMKKLNFILPAFALFALVLISCKGEKSMAEKLDGRWILKSVNDNPVPETAEEVTYFFEAENKGTGERVYNMEHEQGESTFTYEVDNDKLMIVETTAEGDRDWEFKFMVDENNMSLVMGDTMTFKYDRLK